MSYQTLPEGLAALRLEFSIAEAVHQRGLLAVIAAAIAAWWHRPQWPSELPASLRADVGLLPDDGPTLWYSVPPIPAVPSLTLRRRR